MRLFSSRFSPLPLFKATLLISITISPNVIADQQSETQASVEAKYQELLKQHDIDMPAATTDANTEKKTLLKPKPEIVVDPVIEANQDAAALRYEEVLKEQGLNAEDFGQKPDAKDDRVYALSEKMQKQLLDDMIWVEGGSFTMGSEAPEATNREKPAHKVTLDGFYIGKTEFTQDLFEELMGWNVSYFECGQCAMNNVSWSNVQLFIERLNKVTGKEFRLPTEAEWEYAAKGGNKSKNFRFSGSNNIDDVAWYAGNGERKSHPVAQKQANELGLYDMTGNLWEFVHDDMARSIYTKEERVNPVFLRSTDPKKKTMKVIRGGGYEFSANESLMFKRDGATNNVRMPDIGFRLALTSKEASKQASK